MSTPHPGRRFCAEEVLLFSASTLFFTVWLRRQLKITGCEHLASSMEEFDKDMFTMKFPWEGSDKLKPDEKPFPLTVSEIKRDERFYSVISKKYSLIDHIENISDSDVEGMNQTTGFIASMTFACSSSLRAPICPCCR